MKGRCINRRLTVGVGTPPMWKLYYPNITNAYIVDATRDSDMQYGVEDGFGDRLDLHDLQTAVGLAALLDEWEAQNDVVTSWARECADIIGCLPEVRTRFLEKLIARVEYISMDYAIRKKLGWDVDPGSLAEVYYDPEYDGWRVEYLLDLSAPFKITPKPPHKVAGRTALYRMVCSE